MKQLFSIALLGFALFALSAVALGQEIGAKEGDTIEAVVRGKSDPVQVKKPDLCKDKINRVNCTGPPDEMEKSDPYADKVVSWIPGSPGSTEGPSDPKYALGAPDYADNLVDPSLATLGCGGQLVLQFVDNTMVNGRGADLRVFESGTDESFNVSISTNGVSWIDLGNSDGGASNFDIAGKAGDEANFNFVRIKDLKSICGGTRPGVDIDSVKALNMPPVGKTDVKKEASIDYNIKLEPGRAVSGERVKFFFTLINTSDTQDLKNIEFDLVFNPDTGDPGELAGVVGKFQNANGPSCSQSSPADQQNNFPNVFFNEKAYSYHCKLYKLKAGKEESVQFIQENATAGITSCHGFAVSAQTEGKAFRGDCTLEVPEAEASLSVTIDPYRKAPATGIKSETVITVKNTGNARIVEPTINVEFSGAAVPEAGGVPENGVRALRVNASVEKSDGKKAAQVQINWEGKGFDAQIIDDTEFSAGRVYLEPGDSRRIRLSFIPVRGGKLHIAALAGGTTFSDVAVSDFVAESADVEWAEFELSLSSVEPEAYAKSDKSNLPLHQGDKITLEYVLRNTSQTAEIKNGSFRINTLRGKNLSISSDDDEAVCPELETTARTGMCHFSNLKAGEKLKFSATMKYQSPEDFHVLAKAGGILKTDHYLTGPEVNPSVRVKFDPDPERVNVSPGTAISAQFIVINFAADTLEGGELVIYAPESYSSVYLDKITGCRRFFMDRQAYSDEYSSYPEHCVLNDFSLEKTAIINVQFSKITEKDLHKVLIFVWELKMPEHFFEPGDETQGRVLYVISPKIADLYVEGFRYLGESLPGKTETVELDIGNKGTVSKDKVTLTVLIDFKGDENLNPLVVNKTSWVKRIYSITDAEDDTIVTSDCARVGIGLNQFDCDLGKIDPEETAHVYIDWEPDMPAGITYSYHAFFEEDGVGEKRRALRNNKVRGSGRVVEKLSQPPEDPDELGIDPEE